MILHVPHASLHIPTDVRPALLLSDEDLRAELITMTDAHTDKLFVAGPNDCVVRYPVSRLVLDPERFETNDPMEAKGMGLIYTRTADGGMLRHAPNPAERQRLIDTYYHPHHLRLEQAVTQALNEEGFATIVDAHSFPDTKLPYEDDPLRPDLCIGTDAYHTPSGLADALIELAATWGWHTAINRPFAGSLVPLRYYQSNPHVHSVMFEINRKHYMDSTTGEPHDGFDACQARVTALLDVVRHYNGESNQVEVVDESPLNTN